MIHIPVLLNEVVKFFDPKEGDRFVDATAGEGGHTKALKESGGDVISIDMNPRKGFIKKGNFRDIDKFVSGKVKGILFDLGMSSWNIDNSEKGFSFQKDEELDMRFGDEGITAKEILNDSSKEKLERIFKEYGEERSAKQIAECILKVRPIETTTELNECLFSVKTKARIYQALRIEVNNELDNVLGGVSKAMELADRVAVITYHSLEDRIVKNLFKNRLLIRPSSEEVEENPRARSAKLRLWVKEDTKE
tara:strand:+ start:451 stop:1200 length:750 start_codon:yes stop_codon:yes gene_type:complete